MPASTNGSQFNIIGLLITVMLVVAVLALSLPMLALHRQKARRAQHDTQIRGIHQSLVIFSQSSKNGGQDGYFTGLHMQTGSIVPDSLRTGFSGDGTHPAARYWMLLEYNAFTPDYAISPADVGKIEAVMNPATNRFEKVTAANYSFSMMSLLGSENEMAEWKETLHPSAIVLSDRAIGTDPGDISSVWAEPGSGQWEGSAAHNDNSVAQQTSHKFKFTKYGDGAVNAWDDLFADDPAADDGYMVYEDATTAYSED